MSPTRSASPPGARPGRRSSLGKTRDVEVATLSKGLAHPARVAILRLLLEKGDCQCGAIVDRLPLAQATVSQHLKVLKDAGLIRGEIDPPRVCYCVNPETILRLKTLIQEL